MFPLLFALTACAHRPSGQMATTLDHPPTCTDVQNGLKEKGRKATYTGSCRADLVFEDAPRPAEIAMQLDMERAALASCVEHGAAATQYTADVEINVWRNGSDKVRVRIIDTSQGDAGFATYPTAQCIATVLDATPFPAPIASVNYHGKWQIIPGYTVSWHYSYRADLSSL